MKRINVDGLENYLITEDGRIFSEKRGIFIRPSLSTKGYKQVSLRNKGKSKNYYVHRLLMETHRPITNEKEMCVNHIDGNKTNNNLDNLEWVTKQQNLIHALTSGLRDMSKHVTSGEKNGNSRLSESDVLFIYKSQKEKTMSTKELAEKFHVSKTTVLNIKNKKKWASLTSSLD